MISLSPTISSGALADALTLVRLAMNPKDAASFLEEVHATVQKNQELLDSLNPRMKVIEEREKNVSIRETSYRDLEEKIAAFESEKAAHVSAVALHVQNATNTAANIEMKAEQLATNAKTLAADKLAFEQEKYNRTTELNARQKALLDKESEYAAKMAKLKELV